MTRSSLLTLILFLFSTLCHAEVPIERDFLNLPDGRWIWLKKVDAQKTWMILGKGRKSVQNRIWSKFYESDGKNQTWAYAFFVRLKLDRFIDQDSRGNMKFALSTYDMGNGIVRDATVYRILKNRLEIVETVANYNVEADESVYEKKIVPRNLHPYLKISDIPRWVGKYSFDEIEGASLFSIKAVNDHLKAILGNTKYKEFLAIEEIGPQSPLASDDGVVHFTVCQKHNCGHMFYFLLDITSGKLAVCEREMGLKLRATWFYEKGSYVTPEGDCESYDENKKATDWKRTYESIP